MALGLTDKVAVVAEFDVTARSHACDVAAAEGCSSLLAAADDKRQACWDLHVKTAKALSAETGDWAGRLQSVADEPAAIERFGTVEELANFFVFLRSDRAAHAVGSTCFVDGGMLRTI